MHEYLEWVEVTEACGYYLAGYGDTQNLLPDPYLEKIVSVKVFE